MAKIQFVIGLDVDLYQAIESKRGKIPRATFINKLLREVFNKDLSRNS